MAMGAKAVLACWHDQNISGFFGGPALIRPITAISIVFKKPWLAGKKPALQKIHFCFDHVNRLFISLFTWSKQKRLFWRAGFYLANQSNQKTFKKLWLAGKKPALQKATFVWSCKQVIYMHNLKVSLCNEP